MKNNLVLNFNLSTVIVDSFCSSLLLWRDKAGENINSHYLNIFSAFAPFTPVVAHIVWSLQVFQLDTRKPVTWCTELPYTVFPLTGTHSVTSEVRATLYPFKVLSPISLLCYLPFKLPPRPSLKSYPSHPLTPVNGY